MLPKARVIAALRHQEPDRVPTGEIEMDWEIVESALGHRTFLGSKWREWQAVWNGQRDTVALARELDWDYVPVLLMPTRRDTYEQPEFPGGVHLA